MTFKKDTYANWGQLMFPLTADILRLMIGLYLYITIICVGYLHLWVWFLNLTAIIKSQSEN